MIAHFLSSDVVQRRTGLSLFVVVLVVLVLYGTSTTPAPRAVAVVGPVAAFECALPQDVAGFLAAPPISRQVGQRPERGTVPDTFDPVTAVVCDVDVGPKVSADGTATYVEHHYTGDLGSAVRELNAPSERRTLFPAACGDSSFPAPVDMWLVDAHGQAMEPSYPLSDCGLERTLGLFEVQSEAETDRIVHEVRIDTTGIARFFNCSPVFTTVTQGAETQLGPPIYSSWSFCRFDVSGPSAAFLGAERHDNPEGLPEAGLTDLSPAPACSQTATTLATTTTSSIDESGLPIEMTVELDGCRRILLEGYVPFSSPPDLVNTILTGSK